MPGGDPNGPKKRVSIDEEAIPAAIMAVQEALDDPAVKEKAKESLYIALGYLLGAERIDGAK